MTAPWRTEPLPRLKGFTVEWAEPDDYILSRRDTLYHSRDLAPPFTPIGRFPLGTITRLGSRVDLVRRALRAAYYNVVRVGEERIVVTFDRSVAVLCEGRMRPVAGLDRPFRVLRGASALTSDGSIWMGEYVRTREPTPVRIYRLPPDGERLEVVHTFPADFARHVHGVYVDPFDDSLWCLTGDAGDHCKILRSADGVERFTPVGGGDESWRAVSIQFRGDAAYYATDAEYAANVLYRLDRRTGERAEIARLDGPVYYSHRVGDDLFFAISAELCPSQVGRSATLLHLDGEDRLTTVESFTKDFWPVHQFQPGTFSFPRGRGAGSGFVFSVVAVTGARTPFCCRRAESA